MPNSTDTKNIVGIVARMQQHVRNGNSAFVILFDEHRVLEGHPRTKLLVIEANDCPKGFVDVLALARPGDMLRMEFEEQLDNDPRHRCWRAVQIDSSRPLTYHPSIPN